jgi:hypothetical protein
MREDFLDIVFDGLPELPPGYAGRESNSSGPTGYRWQRTNG